MTWQAQFLFGIVDYNFLLFIFASTICSYGFHALVNISELSTNNREKWNFKNRKHLLITTFLSGLLALFTLLPYLHSILPLLLAIVSTFLYSAPNLSFKPFIWLRRIAFGKTIYLALVWTYITTILPILIQHQKIDINHFIIYLFNRFFLVYAICILFDYRDLQADRIKGVKSITTRFSQKNIKIIYYFSLIVSITFGICIYLDGKHKEESIYLMVAPSIGLLLFHKSLESQDLFFDFFLDGLMMMAAILQLIHLIWLKFTNL